MSPPFTMKDYQHESRLFQRRVLLALLLICIAFFCLIGRLIYLQIVEHSLYTTLSQQNQLNIVPLAPKRGLIYDRNGILLAKNRPIFSLDVIPELTGNVAKTLQQLQHVIPLTASEIKQFNQNRRRTRHFQPVPLKLNLSEKEFALFSVNRYRFPGVISTARLIRQYPFGAVMAPVVGYVGRINRRELKNIDAANYANSNYIGKVGIEKYYETRLHGQTGNEQAEIDASGRIVRTLKRTPATAGKNLYLTIDSHVQQAAYQALGDDAGAVVAIDPSNGEILAMVSKPSYDPNLFVNGISEQQYQHLQQTLDKPFYNRPIRGQYPIASTIKPFLGLEALANGVITPEYTIFDPGYFKLPNNQHVYHDWYRPGHGHVNLSLAIMVSCDTYFYHLAYKLGIDRIDNILRHFGFGKQTGIDLNEELPGLVASPDWKMGHIGHPWYAGDTINAGIGQGYLLATPLQLANAAATLAERGSRYPPHLLTTDTPLALPRIDLPISSWHVVLQAMIGVIKQPYGTGFRFGRRAPYSAAAKTGTAQVYSKDKLTFKGKILPKKLRDHSLFIAFAPFKPAKIAVAIVVEHSSKAPIVARKVIDAYLLRAKHVAT